ncbi:MAG: thiamine pyrophosphate-dependent enzyme, partial [Chloroflexota bacterium]
LARQAEVTLREPLAPEKEAGDPSLVEHAADVLAGARRPLIIAGGGVLAAEAWDELRAVAEALDAPVVMTVSGRGVLTDRHALATTLLALPDLLPTSDVVLAIGTRMLGFGSQPIRLPAGAVLVRVDADRAQLHRTVPAMIAVAGDAKLVLGALAGQVERRDRNGESRREDIAAINRALSERLSAAEPQASLGRAIRDSIPDDAIVIHESTQVAYWARAAMPFYEPRTYITSGYQGTLGCGFPTALGARVGNPDRTVVSLNGDGGFMFNVQEMATAVQHNIGVTIVVFNDGAFGNVKRIQEESFGGRTIGSELRNPDFVGLARSFGMPGVQAAGADALRGALREASTHDGPVLIEVPVGPMPNFQRQLRERVARSLSVTAG